MTVHDKNVGICVRNIHIHRSDIYICCLLVSMKICVREFLFNASSLNAAHAYFPFQQNIVADNSFDKRILSLKLAKFSL